MSNKKVTVTYNDSTLLNEVELANSNVVYNGSTIINDGVYTDKLRRSDKVMTTDVIIGDTKTLKCAGNYMTADITITSILATQFILVKPTNLTPSATYTGSTITNGYTTPANCTMSGSNSGTNAGTYIATYTPNDGYGWTDGTTSAVTVTLTINKAASSVTTAPTNKGVTYSGSAQAIANAGTCSGGTLYYKAASTGQTSYGTSIPTATNAGSYTLYYYVKGDSNHYDSSEAAVSCSIATATMTVTPTAASKTYDTGSTYAQIKVNIAGATVEYGTSTSYGYSLTASSANTNYGMSSVTRTEYGTTTVYYKVTKTNYTTITGSTTIGISKLSLTIPTLSNSSKDYTGSSQSPTINNYNSTYETQSGTTSATDAGNWTITWSLKNTTSTQWSDGTTGNKIGSWSIGYCITASTASLLGFTYMGG